MHENNLNTLGVVDTKHNFKGCIEKEDVLGKLLLSSAEGLVSD
jgi:hypothetical protein